MKNLFLISVLLLAGCSATQIQYSPEVMNDRNDAVMVVEQVVMEQPIKHRPSSVLITEHYIAFNEGFETNTSGFVSGSSIGNNSAILSGSTRSTSKAVGSRIYFNSITVPNLYKKRGWYIIDILNTEGRRVKRIYTTNKQKAEDFIDSIFFLMSDKQSEKLEEDSKQSFAVL